MNRSPALFCLLLLTVFMWGQSGAHSPGRTRFRRVTLDEATAVDEISSHLQRRSSIIISESGLPSTVIGS